MKVLLSFLVLSSLTVHAALSRSFNSRLEVADVAQTVLSQSDELRLRRLDEVKQLVLRGKKNLETWVYKGRHYIKQDNLLCSINSLSLYTG